jgi:predicted metalloprotease with PDZ domain
MKSLSIFRGLGLFLGLLCSGGALAVAEPEGNAASYATKADPVILVLDVREAGRGVLTTSMSIPVKPGPFTLVYPKWIPGWHTPKGPLNSVAEIKVSAKGQPLGWSRDPVDMYAFHVTVPDGIDKLDVKFTVLANAQMTTVTSNLAVVNWNQVLFYQHQTRAEDVYFKPSIILPDGWSFATALPDPRQHGQQVDFGTVSLDTLVDSPLDCGRYFKHIELWRDGSAYHMLDLFADAPQSLDVPPELISKYKKLAQEALAIYGSRHWDRYHSLLTLSDRIGFAGIEHHQSSDNRAPADYFTNANSQLIVGDLLTHEFSHSWMGKYLRPRDHATANFQIAQQTDLLWVYEGINQYLGDILSFRLGVRKAEDYPSYLASLYADLASEPGRNTTSLIEVATAAPLLYQAGGVDSSIRRSASDFYLEGELLWLDVDSIIREKTQGKKSLQTFLKLFSAPALTGPITKTYTRGDVEGLLNQVTPYDWHGFFQQHVYEIATTPPTDELERAGWKLVYTSEPNIFVAAAESLRHSNYHWLSYGLLIDKDDTVTEVRVGSPAWQGGLTTGMKIVALDGQAYTDTRLRDISIRAQQTTGPTAFLVQQDGWYRTLSVKYHEGPKYPHLVRIPDRPDMLARITSPQS